MAESGGAERIANTLIDRFGKKRVHWAMMFVAFLVGIPVFFQVGFVLLIPLVFTIALETGVSLITIGIPLVAGLSVVHGLVPPHPAAMAAVGIFKADGEDNFICVNCRTSNCNYFSHFMENGLVLVYIRKYH